MKMKPGRIFYMQDYKYTDQDLPLNRGVLLQVHIADLHFGAFNPKEQYDILMKQFIEPVSQLPELQVISVDGDFFDHKVMSNSDIAMYATMFADQLVKLAIQFNATLVILAGTYSHDYDQLKLFYHYMENTDVDVRIVTSIQFENIKGARVLCIPELYGVDEEVYQKFLFYSGYYDEAFVHGTFEGSVYGNNVGRGRLFTAGDFIYCKGLAVSGHVHTPGCFQGFYYYCGCPYRWKFGEEEDKGFLIIAHNLDNQYHSVDFIKIDSPKYITIYMDELISNDPQQIINFIDTKQQAEGIDYIKVRIRVPVQPVAKNVIAQYYQNNKNTFVEFIEEKKETIFEKNATSDSYNFLIDDKISDLERFCLFVNENEGEQFITVEKLKEILSSDNI